MNAKDMLLSTKDERLLIEKYFISTTKTSMLLLLLLLLLLRNFLDFGVVFVVSNDFGPLCTWMSILSVLQGCCLQS